MFDILVVDNPTCPLATHIGHIDLLSAFSADEWGDKTLYFRHTVSQSLCARRLPLRNSCVTPLLTREGNGGSPVTHNPHATAAATSAWRKTSAGCSGGTCPMPCARGGPTTSERHGRVDRTGFENQNGAQSADPARAGAAVSVTCTERLAVESLGPAAGAAGAKLRPPKSRPSISSDADESTGAAARAGATPEAGAPTGSPTARLRRATSEAGGASREPAPTNTSNTHTTAQSLDHGMQV